MEPLWKTKLFYINTEHAQIFLYVCLVVFCMLCVITLYFLSASVPASPCQPNPCKNGGACVKGNRRFHCTCRNGYGGKFCEVGKGLMICKIWCDFRFSFFHQLLFLLTHKRASLTPFVLQLPLTAMWATARATGAWSAWQRAGPIASTGTPTSSWPTGRILSPCTPTLTVWRGTTTAGRIKLIFRPAMWIQ